ncbi:hypothetical protein QBC35DRAFT_497043 [Podospora australis]|uniref:Extracellular serine-rich protein n=1 Tax=Podospora australis TaxID=1536484 RepID=A0AAN6WTW1_9PEZI|nr:hypothetical protein QBC35DRAFT_497043 [Podospora australis]
MHLPTLLLTGLSLLHSTSAIQFNVSVGRTGLTFEPNQIRAAAGDVVEFRFWARNHSVVSGRFTHACVPTEVGGFYSGFFPTPVDTINPQVFRITINNSDPIVFYCSQNNGQHCKNGMYGIINPTQGGASSLAGYARLASQAGNATSPRGSAFGGQVAQNPNTSLPPGFSPTGSGSATAVSSSVTSSVATITSGSTTITSTSVSSATVTNTATSSTATAAAGPTAVAGPVAGLLVAAAALLFV